MIAVGTPAKVEERQYNYGFLQNVTVPKLFVSGEQDQFAAPEQLRAMVAALPEPKQLTIIKGADHFFEPGYLPELRKTVEEWVTGFLAKSV
jgi:alpha/beta superfamily hydrolase